MVDPIGIKAAPLGDRRLVRIDAAKATEAAKPVKADDQAETVATQLSSAMAAAPPVDVDRVSRIKKAIKDGNFPTLPATIADRLLALKLEWDPNEAS